MTPQIGLPPILHTREALIPVHDTLHTTIGSVIYRMKRRLQNLTGIWHLLFIWRPASAVLLLFYNGTYRLARTLVECWLSMFLTFPSKSWLGCTCPDVLYTTLISAVRGVSAYPRICNKQMALIKSCDTPGKNRSKCPSLVAELYVTFPQSNISYICVSSNVLWEMLMYNEPCHVIVKDRKGVFLACSGILILIQ
jgi:hypothetical protein